MGALMTGRGIGFTGLCSQPNRSDAHTKNLFRMSLSLSNVVGDTFPFFRRMSRNFLILSVVTSSMYSALIGI